MLNGNGRPLTEADVERFISAERPLTEFLKAVREAVDGQYYYGFPISVMESRSRSASLVLNNRRIFALLPEGQMPNPDRIHLIRESFVLATYGYAESGITPKQQVSEVLRERFEGATLLQAYALAFSCRPQEILALTADEVAVHYRIAAGALPGYLTWETLSKLVKLDVDDSLVSSLLSSMDADVERLAR
jgi:hypothetical protein